MNYAYTPDGISVQIELELLRLPEMQAELRRDRDLVESPAPSIDFTSAPPDGWKTSLDENLTTIQKLIMALDKEPRMLSVNIMPLTEGDRKLSKDFRDVLQVMHESMNVLAQLYETEKDDERKEILVRHVIQGKLIEDEISSFVDVCCGGKGDDLEDVIVGSARRTKGTEDPMDYPFLETFHNEARRTLRMKDRIARANEERLALMQRVYAN